MGSDDALEPGEKCPKIYYIQVKIQVLPNHLPQRPTLHAVCRPFTPAPCQGGRLIRDKLYSVVELILSVAWLPLRFSNKYLESPRKHCQSRKMANSPGMSM